MKTIKFSHPYDKLPAGYYLSKLLDVIPVKLEDLSKDFIKYDTAFSFTANDGVWDSYYPLPAKGNYMILLLQAGSGNGRIWTTIRSQWGKSGNKLEYYRNSIGEIFECKIVPPVRT